MIQVILNGQPESLQPDLSVLALLEARGLVGKRLAVERNGEIVPKARHAEVKLADGDRLESADFATILKSMLVDVSQTQQHATRMAESFELGQHQDLASVMVDQQKAKLAFQTTLQVRNKLMSAYQDIMNMPV